MDIEAMGSVKIKDGLFVGDAFAAQVLLPLIKGFRVCAGEQGDACDKLRESAA